MERKHKILGLGLFGWAVLLLLLLTIERLPQTMAKELPPGEELEVAQVKVMATPLCCDDQHIEFGAEYVQSYEGGKEERCPPWWQRRLGAKCVTWDTNDLKYTYNDAASIYNHRIKYGFLYGNENAKPSHWYVRGSKYPYISNVDLAYFSGHGSGGDATHYPTINFYDSILLPRDCVGKWGGDTEWIAFSACLTQENEVSRSHWYQCFNGLHLLLGFETTMDDVDLGQHFAAYLRSTSSTGKYQNTIAQSWFKAADRSVSQGQVARAMAEEKRFFNDTLANHNSPDPSNDGAFNRLRHPVGSEPPRHVNIAQLGGVMPVYETPPLSLDEANTRWDDLSQAFAIPTTAARNSSVFRISQDGNDIRVSDNGYLEMDTSSGLFAHTDLERLWTVVTTTQTAATARPMRTLAPNDARQIADQFLSANGLRPGDAQFYEVVADTMAEGGPAVNLQATTPETMTYQVIYSRIVTYIPTSEMGVNTPQSPIEFSVIGPGAKLKVYVAPEAPAGQSLAQAATAEESVLGAVGGWRSVEATGNRALAVQETVPILTYAQIKTLFDALEPVVSLSYQPVALTTSYEILTYTLAYYEHSMGTGQDQLIPVYVLTVRYTLQEDGMQTNMVYIPANPEFMAPLAVLTYTAGMPLTPTVQVGQQIVLEAVDASQTLAALGYDAALNFALGTGDPDSYLYTWYLNSVADENRIGVGRVLTYTVSAGQSTDEMGLSQDIILEVTDGLSPRPPSTSTFTYQLTVIPPLYLPLVLRNM